MCKESGVCQHYTSVITYLSAAVWRRLGVSTFYLALPVYIQLSEVRKHTLYITCSFPAVSRKWSVSTQCPAYYLVISSCVKKVNLQSVGTKFEIFRVQILHSWPVLRLVKWIKVWINYKIIKITLNVLLRNLLRMADFPTLLSPITTTLILSSSEAILALSGLATLWWLALGCSSHLYHLQAVWEKMQEAG